MSSMPDMPAITPQAPSDVILNIGTFAELMQHEAAITARIARVPNGGQLFLINPFRMLADVGVKLAPEVVREIIRLEPNLSALSDHAYAALKAAPQQKVQFHIRGLFRGDRRERLS